MKKILTHLSEGAFLSREEAQESLIQIGSGSVPDEQIVALMSTLQVRGLHIDELTGFRDALLELALPVSLDCGPAIDVCGTGGDGKNTFNISTATAFVLASMGYKVIKHGNHGVSSFCGSSTVLEALGYTFTDQQDELQRQLDTRNLCFLHAPLFHPALKRVAPLRKSLGVPTFFNSMGPLVNPAQPSHQLTGTHSMELARSYPHLLHGKRSQYTIVHGLDGFDELTFIGTSRILGSNRDELIHGAPNGQPVHLRALQATTSIAASVQTLLAVLRGKATPEQLAVVAGNTALGLQTFHPELPFATAYERALEHLYSGAAFSTIQPT